MSIRCHRLIEMRSQGIRGFRVSFSGIGVADGITVQGSISRQFIKTSAEVKVTPKGGIIRESYMCHQDTSVA